MSGPLVPLSCRSQGRARAETFPPEAKMLCWAEPQPTRALMDWFASYFLARKAMVCRPVLVLDLDETAFKGSEPETQKANPLVFGLARLAKSLGYGVILITARPYKTGPEDPGRGNRDFTLEQLGILGYSGLFDELKMSTYLEEDDSLYDNCAREKKDHRDALRARGFSVVCNIGDQWSDHFARANWDALEQAESQGLSKKMILFENDLELPERTLCVKLPRA